MDECTLNDLLECSVCLERLDTSSRVLPCQHTFCKKCLEEIVSTHRELRCPECRILVDAKIEELPPNVLLMRILEGMRNATPKIAKSSSKGNSGTQRLFGGHQIAPAPTAFSTSAIPSGTTNAIVAVTTGLVHTAVVPNESSRHHNPSIKQSPTQSQAFARALYDYVSKVPGDLSFKKGDVIILKKKIDNNWYLGENGNNHGVFPLSYVQVMTPLAAHVPQCKALYDFKMTNDEEDGCLIFSKGEVISVIRRVDENWAEGKLSNRIGIFPLAFVELNNVARALMKLSTNTQPGPSRVAPPTPTSEETTPLIPTDHTRTVQANNNSRPQVIQGTATSVSDSVSSGSSGSSSTTTTPNTPNSSNTSSSSSTAPSSPSSPAVSPPILGNRHNLKRHSFTAVNSSQQVRPQHRHSAEILSPTLVAGSTVDEGKTSLSNNPSSTSLVTSASPTEHGIRHRRSGSSDLVLAQSSQNTTSSNLSGNSGLPAAYVALYPYKPQKADELELRKGGIYMVTERCQDGWFKGTSNRTQKCGVFPGNYVALAKCQRGLCRGSPNTGQISNSSFPSGQSNNETRVTSGTNTCGKNKGSIAHSQAQVQSHNQYSSRTALPPPELPPRALSPAPVVSSPWHGQSQVQSHTHLHAHSHSHTHTHTHTHPPNREDCPPAQHCEPQKPVNQLGRSHSAAITTNLVVTSSPGKQLSPSATALLTNSTVVSPVSVSNSLTSASNTAANTAIVPSPSASPSPSPSPSPSSLMANATATVAATAAAAAAAAVAAASSNPLDCNRSPCNTSRIANAIGTSSSPNTSCSAATSSKFPDKPKEKKDKCVSLMRRLTNMKKSKSPPPAAYSMDNPVFEDGNAAIPIHIRSGSCPSQLLDAGLDQELNTSVTHHRSCPGSTQGAHVSSSQRVKYKERPSLPLSILQRSNDATGMICTSLIGNHHRKSNSLDAGMGKQLKQQSTRERDRVYRFRCIVPYPPNSEFELELRIGDIIYVHKKRDDGWYKGTQQRTGRTGLFPASFVEAF